MTAHVPTEDAEDDTHAAFEPMNMLIGAATPAFIADRVMRFVTDLRRDGLIVAPRVDGLSLREHPSLDHTLTARAIPQPISVSTDTAYNSNLYRRDP